MYKAQEDEKRSFQTVTEMTVCVLLEGESLSASALRLPPCPGCAASSRELNSEVLYEDSIVGLFTVKVST